jgi:hypothetical protein
MPDLQSDRGSSALLFVLTSVGVVIFGLIHLLEYAGDFAVELGFGSGDHDHAHDHLDDVAAIVENPSFLWMFVAYFGLAVVIPLIAALGRGRVAAWSVFGLGALLVVVSVLDGLGHALGDGDWHSLVTALLVVGLPGYFACRSALRWARQPSFEAAIRTN